MPNPEAGEDDPPPDPVGDEPADYVFDAWYSAI